MTHHASQSGAPLREPALLVEPAASTNFASHNCQEGGSAHRPSRTARLMAQLTTATCATAALCAVSAPASPSSTGVAAFTTPNYVTTMNASDLMSRTVSGGFGTAPSGGSYLTTPATKFSVSAGVGHITSIAHGPAVSATLSVVHPADEQVQSTFSLPSYPTTGLGVYYQLEIRRQVNGDAYRVQVRIAPGGRMTLAFNQMRANVTTAIGLQMTVPQSASFGHTIVLQGLAAGSSSVALRARAWIAGSAVPAWQLAATDSSATRSTATGQIGMLAAVSAMTQAEPVQVGSITGWALSAPAAVPPGPREPGPTNTGVPAGTPLTQHHGDMVITTPGATYDALDIHGFVTIRAANVHITRSIIRGGVATSGSVGLVTDVDARGTGFVLTDSEVVPEHPSVYMDGIKGWNYTLTRVNIHGTVDAAKVYGNNATIQNSWLHDTVYYAVDPNQGGGHTHNDGVQVLSGTRIRILGNTVTGSYNSALQVTQDHGAVSDLWFNGNWADGGGCSVNINNGPLASMSAITVDDNRFGHATRVANCPMIVTHATALTALRNVYDDTGAAVVIKNGG